MKKYSIFHPYWMAFFSKNLYKDVAANWRGYGFLYLFLFTILFSIPLTFATYRSIQNDALPAVNAFIDQVPSFSIKNGVLTTEEDKTYTILEPGTNSILAVINPAPGQDLSSVPVIVEKTQLIAKKSKVETRTIQFDQIDEFEYTQGSLSPYIDGVGGALALVLMPFIALAFFIWHIFKSFIFSIVGLLLSAILRAKLAYGTILRLTSIALTPSLILQAIGAGTGNSFLWGSVLLSFTLVLIYQIFAILSAKSIPADDTQSDSLTQ